MVGTYALLLAAGLALGIPSRYLIGQAVVLAAGAVAALLIRRGRTRLAAQTALAVLWCHLHVLVAMAGSLSSMIAIAFPVVILGASVALGRSWGYALASSAAVSAPLAAWATSVGLSSLGGLHLLSWIIFTASLLGTAAMADLGLRGLRVAYAAAVEAEARLRARVRDAPDGILAVGPDDRVADANPVALRLLGEPGSVVGRRLEDLLDPVPTAAGAVPSGAWIAENGPATFTPRTLSRGGPFVDVTAGRWSQEGGSDGYEIVLRDVTARVERDRIREVLEEEARASERLESMSHMAGRVAHEFNNLLTVIAASVDLVADAPPAEVADHVAEMLPALERGRDLTRHLLAAARFGVVRPVPVDLTTFVASRTQAFQQRLGSRITLDVFAEAALTILADPAALENALDLLLDNARDALGNGGHVTVSARASAAPDPAGVGRPDAHALIEVGDDGPGMSAEVMARAFDPFFTTRFPERTGLGLSTVLGIVRQHGGSAELVSGEGTSVILRWPLDDPGMPTRDIGPEEGTDAGHDARVPN